MPTIFYRIPGYTGGGNTGGGNSSTTLISSVENSYPSGLQSISQEYTSSTGKNHGFATGGDLPGGYKIFPSPTFSTRDGVTSINVTGYKLGSGASSQTSTSLSARYYTMIFNEWKRRRTTQYSSTGVTYSYGDWRNVNQRIFEIPCFFETARVLTAKQASDMTIPAAPSMSIVDNAGAPITTATFSQIPSQWGGGGTAPIVITKGPTSVSRNYFGSVQEIDVVYEISSAIATFDYYNQA